MIVRPPEKKISSKAATSSFPFSKVANDNKPPKKAFLGWILFIIGLVLLMGALFWFYENII